MPPVTTIQQHGPAIRALRIKDGLSVEGLADMVGCVQSVISHIELEDKRPSEQMLNRIARALHVPVAAISREPLVAEPPTELADEDELVRESA
ncbi:helix-turn-helix domain-containing protein [Streptosporangium sp. G12]